MIVGQVIKEGGAKEEHVEDDTGAQGDDTTAQGYDAQEPSIPSPTLPTPPLQQPQDIPLTSQVQHTPPQSPQPQPQPQHQAQQQVADFPMSILQEALDACAALSKRVEHLEYDKVAQALEITKLKSRVDTSEDTMMDDASNQGRKIDELDKDDVVALMDDKEEEKKEEEAKDDQEDEPAEVKEVVDVVTTAKLITEVVTATNETVATSSTIIFAAEPQVPAATITAAHVKVAAAFTRRKKGVVTRDPEKKSTTIIPVDTKSKDKGKGIMAKEDLAVQRYQVMKKRPQTEAQAQNNMIMYLKNVVGLRLDYFKGMSYDDICPTFKAKFNSNIEFLIKKKEQMKEEESRALQSINETPAQKAAKKRKVNEEVKDLKRHLEIVPDEDDDVYT
nr:hypothetical protein [Tanacetum cinerariifolium]